MKLALIVCLISIHNWISAQCPVAGNDTLVEYCKNEVFDLETILTFSADSGGIFIDPAMNLIEGSDTSLIFPGLYTFHYVVSAPGCTPDSAKLIVKILNCFPGGITETANHNILLVFPNPASNQLNLKNNNYENLELISLEGKPILILENPLPETIDVSLLASGWYLIKVKKHNQLLINRIFVIRNS